jgi:hypothetical protein
MNSQEGYAVASPYPRYRLRRWGEEEETPPVPDFAMLLNCLHVPIAVLIGIRHLWHMVGNRSHYLWLADAVTALRQCFRSAGKFRTMVGLISMVVLSGCGSRESNDARSAWHRPDWSQSAPFRMAARDVYRNLLQESCEPDPRLKRSTVLAAEAVMVRNFEAKVTTQPVASQLGLARRDIEYLLAKPDAMCWADSDLAFATKHIEMARESVRVGLASLESMVLASTAWGVIPSGGPNAAQFRAGVRDLVDRLWPACALHRLTSNDEILATGRAEFARLKTRIAATPYADQFSVAEADARYLASQTIVECAEPSSETVDAAEKNYFSMYNYQLRFWRNWLNFDNCRCKKMRGFIISHRALSEIGQGTRLRSD